MTQTLYNLRTSDPGYRVTKFTDGEVESSYLTSDQACDCPAGHRHTCRHRLMLPILLPIVDTEWFWDYMQSRMVNLMGTPRPARVPAEQDTERQTFTIPNGFEAERDADGRATGKVVIAEQHTAAEGLPPEETVAEPYGTSPFILEGGLDAIKADNERMKTKIIAHERANSWRRL